MIAEWDIAILKRWLKLAKVEGTDAIRVVSGDNPNTYVVTVGKPDKGMEHLFSWYECSLPVA
ncbi:unnamed protein product [marine sediment metagenome]|uniref:Uncharacterized protein n=1 Tax=marine sediment metagenome TaxID=412755 RepID=X1KGL9_9ZZZZ